MVDANGNIPVLNRRAIELLDLPPELVANRPTGQSSWEWQLANREFGDEDKWPVPRWRMRAFPRGAMETTPMSVPARTGRCLKCAPRACPMARFVRTFTDITDRKHNEAALAAARARAAHAERMQVLGQLAGGIAHDFNNILQAVQGGAA